MSYVSSLFYYFFTPQSVADVGIFYFLWIALFMFTNIIWDVFSPNTESFHIIKLKDKISTLHSATFFCSSLLLLMAVWEPNVWLLAKETYLPIILAGASGMLSSAPYLCPYDVNGLKKKAYMPPTV
jgi:hypothetical protein